MSRLLLLVGLLAALVGCSAAPAPPTTAPLTATSVPTPAAVGVAAPPAPTAVTIPVISASSTLVPLGLNADGTMTVPPITEPLQAAYYDEGVTPGAVGPAIITGHSSGRQDGESVPGVFARLSELAPGDEVFTETSTGERLRWVVERIETYDKDAFDWAEVAGDVVGPELRLITCSGDLTTLPDGSRSYSDNTAVFARLA